MAEPAGPLQNQFVLNTLSLYHGPRVKMKIGSHDYEYLVSKDLLCSKSAYFSTMFNGPSQESQEQAATLEEGEGLSVRTFNALIQWLYTGEVKFNVKDRSEKILDAIELARVALMWNVSDLESPTAEYIKRIILRNDFQNFSSNVRYIGSDHIASVCLLPSGNSVRQMLAAASVEEFFLVDTFKLAKEAQENPEFAADLLHEIHEPLRRVMGRLEYSNQMRDLFEDPLSGRPFPV
ncbi:hypothetical protein N7481_007391 [Penicillium waksmanii]|uniref:uncharacterized protein n=1 Tax=Penicillium waksmanii TaxID=69791 RepID=UPI0025467A50|nr:uncharacterized protein N7481_007391 [Penicillium waksmanii]KAJ5980093.1 hypothetical protein N7481_007391 [Penicillium waksmanii]